MLDYAKNLYPNPHAPGCYWYEAAEKFGAPNVKYCEETLCQVMSEPANTWSNLSFLFFSLLLVLFHYKKWQTSALKFTPWALLLTGIGSFYYHASNFYISQHLDFTGMYIFLCWILTLSLKRVSSGLLGSQSFYLLQLVIYTLVTHYMYAHEMKFQLLIVLVGVSIAASEFYYQKSSLVKPKVSFRYFWLALICVLSGETLSLLDMKRVLCEPKNHFFQGHATWHILSAACCYFLTLYYAQYEKYFKKNA